MVAAATSSKPAAPRRQYRARAKRGAPLPAELLCGGCDTLLPASEFYGSSLRYSKYRCKARCWQVAFAAPCPTPKPAALTWGLPAVQVCTQLVNQMYKSSNPTRALLWDVHRTEKDSKKSFSAADAAAVLKRCGGACFATGSRGLPLAIVRARVDRPFDVRNAVVVAKCIAKIYRSDGLPPNVLQRFDELPPLVVDDGPRPPSDGASVVVGA